MLILLAAAYKNRMLICKVNHCIAARCPSVKILTNKNPNFRWTNCTTLFKTFCLACTVSQCIQQQGEVTVFSLLIILSKLSRNFVDRSREKHGNTNRTTLGCARTAIKQIVIVSFMGIFFSSPQLDQERRRKHSPKFLYLYLHVDLA